MRGVDQDYGEEQLTVRPQKDEKLSFEEVEEYISLEVVIERDRKLIRNRHAGITE